MKSDIEQARVPADIEEQHPTLFPLSEFSEPPMSPEVVCDRVGLNWMSALSLHRSGWLSFNPKSVGELKPSQKAELTFLGSLVAGGCDGSLLKRLLSGLQKPYAYRISRVYFDWAHRCWRLLGAFDGLEEGFEDWIEELVAWRDLARLESLSGSVEQAIQYMRGVQDSTTPPSSSASLEESY